MDQRVSLITLGVRDVAASRAFYERLGWKAAEVSQPGVAFFQLNGTVLSLYARDDLARDTEAATLGSGPAAMSLGTNFATPAGVDAAFAAAVAAGGRALKAPHEIFWGGYCAFVADPDGFIWEYAHNPHFPLDADDNLILPA